MQKDLKKILKGVLVAAAGLISYKMLNGKSFDKSVKETVQIPEKSLKEAAKIIKDEPKKKSVVKKKKSTKKKTVKKKK